MDLASRCRIRPRHTAWGPRLSVDLPRWRDPSGAAGSDRCVPVRGRGYGKTATAPNGVDRGPLPCIRSVRRRPRPGPPAVAARLVGQPAGPRRGRRFVLRPESGSTSPSAVYEGAADMGRDPSSCIGFSRKDFPGSSGAWQRACFATLRGVSGVGRTPASVRTACDRAPIILRYMARCRRRPLFIVDIVTGDFTGGGHRPCRPSGKTYTS